MTRPPDPDPAVAALVGERVCVHLNLTTGRWTVARKPKGPKVGDAAALTLRAVTFKVSEAQRRYCVERGARWVHAWALGTLAAVGPADTAGMAPVTYNPFRAPTFHAPGAECPVYTAEELHLTADRTAHYR